MESIRIVALPVTTPRARRHKTKVLHVIWNFEYGGLEKVVLDLTSTLDPDRFESHVLTFGRFGDSAHLLENKATTHLAVPQERWSLVRPKALAAQIRAISADVVHTHSGVWHKATLAARMAGVRLCIHTEHGRKSPDPHLDRFLDGLASYRTDVVVAVSDALETQLKSIVAKSATVRRIVNGVDTTQFTPGPSSLRSAVGIASSTPIIGSVGRLEPIKGYDVMLSAWSLLLKHWGFPRPPTLVLVGGGSASASLHRLAHELGIAEHVRFLGYRTDSANCYRAFDVFTLSSHSEGTSISLLEAMSSGVCPVVTAVGGTPAVLGPDLRHRLVPPSDPWLLAQGWMAALTDTSARVRDANLARTRVMETYSLRAMVDQYASLYEGELPTSPSA